jgi:hypothetical protein
MGTRAGTARIDITPTWPVMQGGFGQRTTPSEGVLDAVFAKALYIDCTAPESRSEALLLITADLIAIPHQVSVPVVEAIAAASELAPRQICICASHTHSGPLPSGPSDAPGVAQYSEFLIAALVEVGLAAVADPVACEIGTGTGAVDVFFNRRTRGNPNLVDPRVAVLVAQETAGERRRTVLFGVGCHPVTLGWDNPLISGDYPGVAQRLIEDDEAVDMAMFFNTTEANVIPATSPDRDALDPRGYCGGSPDDADTIGRAIAAEVLRVNGGVATTSDVSIGSARVDIELQANNAAFDLPTAQERLAAASAALASVLGVDFERRAGGFLWALASRHVVETDCSEPDMRRLMIACCEFLGLSARVAHGRSLQPVKVPLQVMRIGDMELLALPGEPLVEVGLAWSAITGHDNSYVIGLANAHLRYLPLRQHFELPDARDQYDTVTAGLEPGAVDRLLDEAAQLLPSVRGV